jgi:cell shape-determining protein MreC
VPGKKDENMGEETITQIKARIKKAKSLNDERKKELLWFKFLRKGGAKSTPVVFSSFLLYTQRIITKTR